MTKKIVIYGGQFNPVHIAHMIVANEVYNHISPDKFYFLPSYMSPLKAHESELNTESRVAMLNLAIEELGFGEICYEDIQREGQSYTYDTIKALTKKENDAIIYIVIGTDQYEQLDKWYKIKELKQLVQFIVVNRGIDNQKVDSEAISITIPRIDISSTMLRDRIKNKETIKILVPPSIEKYIREEGLYEN